ncbi:kelch domain-containing protein 4 [Iris pallida]|uniref:Kelch domain-containing protein 4 n=1 Tax=Iris pallida TaxID=29817 RepID=A0AAX6FM55_IRIPA|nr:kelch domain-containing protein 4 [Iris pallida]
MRRAGRRPSRRGRALHLLRCGGGLIVFSPRGSSSSSLGNHCYFGFILDGTEILEESFFDSQRIHEFVQVTSICYIMASWHSIPRNSMDLIFTTGLKFRIDNRVALLANIAKVKRLTFSSF